VDRQGNERPFRQCDARNSGASTRIVPRAKSRTRDRGSVGGKVRGRRERTSVILISGSELENLFSAPVPMVYTMAGRRRFVKAIFGSVDFVPCLRAQSLEF
jgi:hypothetical protein